MEPIVPIIQEVIPPSIESIPTKPNLPSDEDKAELEELALQNWLDGQVV